MLLWRHIAACDCAWTKRPTVIGFVRTTRVTNVLVFQQVYLMLGPEMNSLCIFLVAPLAIFAASYITDIEPSGPQNRERNDPKHHPLHLLI
jgi:uncharacterized membrane protein YraQ (UPF0718 family)